MLGRRRHGRKVPGNVGVPAAPPVYNLIIGDGFYFEIGDGFRLII